MAGKNVSSVDGKGRILVPQSLRDAAGLSRGEKVVVRFDSENRCISIEPAHEKKLLRLEILLPDKPGSLARAASVLAKLGVDLVSTSSRSSRRGEAAIWEVECNPQGATVAKIKSALAKNGTKLVLYKYG